MIHYRKNGIHKDMGNGACWDGDILPMGAVLFPEYWFAGMMEDPGPYETKKERKGLTGRNPEQNGGQKTGRRTV